MVMNDFSGAILILREGHDSIVRGFGFADRARGVRNGPATRFGIGSITKTFTAAAIAILLARGGPVWAAADIPPMVSHTAANPNATSGHAAGEVDLKA